MDILISYCSTRSWRLQIAPSSVLMSPSVMDGVILLRPKGDDKIMILTTTTTTTTMIRCYIKSSLTGPMVEFPGTESGPKPCKPNRQ